MKFLIKLGLLSLLMLTQVNAQNGVIPVSIQWTGANVVIVHLNDEQITFRGNETREVLLEPETAIRLAVETPQELWRANNFLLIEPTGGEVVLVAIDRVVRFTYTPGTEVLTPIVPSTGESEIKAEPSEPVLETVSERAREYEDVLMFAEFMPTIIGGEEQLYRVLEYPNVARRAQVEGVSVLQFVVDEVGSVQDVRVIRSSGHRSLDNAAIDAINRVTFNPGRQDGENVKVMVTQMVRFSLRR